MDIQSLALVTALLLGFTLLSGRLDGTSLTPPLLFAALGLLIGEVGLGLADLSFEHGFVHTLAEVTLILVLFADAARIDLVQVRRDHNLPVRMLLVGMPLTILAGIGVGLLLPLGLSLWEAALLAAILAPTDAALGQAVVASRHVPARIRQALNIESGLNDGIALPLVLLFASLAAGMSGSEDSGLQWLTFGLMQITLGPLAGLGVGYLAARLIDRAAIAKSMLESYQGAAILGVALLAFAMAELVGGNGFISAFVAGLVFGNTVRGRCGFVFKFAESEAQLLMLLTFLVFGAAILPEAIHSLSWPVMVYALLSLTLVRALPIAGSLAGTGLRPATVLFLAWFGPRGLASILFALLVLEEVNVGASHEILVVVVATVTLSIIAHGISAAPLARRFGAMTASLGECHENRPVSELPMRSRMLD